MIDKSENRDVSRILIVTVVLKGWGDTVIEASMKAGAEGGTILFGRGVGIHEKKRIMGIPVEPEKEIVFTVTPSGKTAAILNEIIKATRLGEPGRGIAFTIPVAQFAGVVHAFTGELPKETQLHSDG